MPDLLQRFKTTVEEHGLRSALARTYLFSEARLLYELSERGLLDGRYREVELADLERSSETAFIMGSGSSVNEISDAGWETIEASGDTIAFNHFYKGEFVPIDYHIVREMTDGRYPTALLRHSQIEAYMGAVDRNPCYEDTTFFALYDARATDVIWATFVLDLLDERSVCFYQNDRAAGLPGESISAVSHNVATLFDAINLAYLLGYDEAVLVGVDLYDRRYFWLADDERRDIDRRRDASHEEAHNTTNPVLREMPRWRDYLGDRGLELAVENDCSLLHTEGILPQYEVEDGSG